MVEGSIRSLIKLDLVSGGGQDKLSEWLGTAPCALGKLRELLDVCVDVSLISER